MFLKTLIATEHQEQSALIHWWSLVCKEYGLEEAHLFAIPNGGARNKVTGSRLKKEGVRQGVPDVFLAVPMGEFSGLFIEMKRTRKSKITGEQYKMAALLIKSGYAVSFCKGQDRAKEVIQEYLKQVKDGTYVSL